VARIDLIASRDSAADASLVDEDLLPLLASRGGGEAGRAVVAASDIRHN